MWVKNKSLSVGTEADFELYYRWKAEQEDIVLSAQSSEDG
jgi:hypothetical protein